ncbi:MAG: putative metal-binding motif-containing protein [Thermoproteota archaeon]|nr:putative metal-binding motif-containing protein [Thermoproteota archaeon]
MTFNEKTTTAKTTTAAILAVTLMGAAVVFALSSIQDVQAVSSKGTENLPTKAQTITNAQPKSRGTVSSGGSGSSNPPPPPPDPSTIDNDGDGFSVAQGDCNDGNPNVYPGAVEVQNGIDDNCNGVVDEVV